MSMEFAEEIEKLDATLGNVSAVLNPEQLRETIIEYEKKASNPNLWDNPDQAQLITSKLAHTQQKLENLLSYQRRLVDLADIWELSQSELAAERSELFQDLRAELKELSREIAALEVQTLLSGKYDERHAVVTIRSGAGGVDAADWAQMLLRMYLRWAERSGYSTQVMDTSYAEEAGIKSATFQVDAPYAYGTLAQEAGTHRLVRLSPFDNQSRRQTSFAAVEVIPLIESSDHIEIPESDLKIDVFRSSGPGGQSVNTTDSAVRMTHLPTGIVVSMQNEKSQLQNKAAALRVLQSRLLQKQREEEEAKKRDLAGDVKASWGDQMRSYVLHPYKMVKDLRTNYESSQVDAVLDGDLSGFLDAEIRWRASTISE